MQTPYRILQWWVPQAYSRDAREVGRLEALLTGFGESKEIGLFLGGSGPSRGRPEG